MINKAIFPPGHFGTQARVIADPVVTAVALSTLNSLRIQSLFSFFTRIGANVVHCFQFTTLIHRLEQQQLQVTLKVT